MKLSRPLLCIGVSIKAFFQSSSVCVVACSFLLWRSIAIGFSDLILDIRYYTLSPVGFLDWYNFSLVRIFI